MNNTATSARFFSYRTLAGWLAGIAILLIFAILFKQSGQFTPTISLLIAIWVSKLSKPQHLTGLGALIGIPAGLVAGIQFSLQNLGQVNAVSLIVAYFSVGIFIVIWAASFSFLGFLLAQLLKLYKRGAIL